ncbi:MAG TPA: hypothetical protein V6D06_06095 [Trichocoleus sp.]
MGQGPTTLSQHRDPRLLWPLLGALSVGVHVLLLGFISLARLDVRPMARGSNTPIPIRLVGQADASTAELSPEAAPADYPEAVAPEDAAADEVPSPPSDSGFTADEPADEGDAQTTAQPPSGAFSESPSEALEPALPEAGTSPNPSNPAPPPAGTLPPGSSGPSGEAGATSGGELTALGIQVDPSGRDLPDTLPQLGSRSVLVQPFLAGCGQSTAALSGITASLQMRITVEANGRISQATVVQSSGNGEVDALASCLVQQGLQLVPATTAGVERPTDAVILDVRLQL